MPSGVRAVQAELFARIPDKWSRPRRSRWAMSVLGVDEVGLFLEGPCFGRDGTLYVSDLAHGRIFAVSPDGSVDVAVEYDGQPNGLALDSDGGLLIADYRRGLCQVEIGSGTVTDLLDGYRLEPFRGLSDLVVSKSGTIYFSDQGQSDLRFPTGRVFQFRPGKGVDLLMDGIASPNGLGLSPDESSLYVSVTRANCVYRLPLLPTGLGKVGVHAYSAGGGGGPDGLAVDDQGGIVFAQYGAGRVWLLDERGLLFGEVHTAGRGTTSVAYGHSDPTELFITEADTGSVMVASGLGRRGLQLTGLTGTSR